MNGTRIPYNFHVKDISSTLCAVMSGQIYFIGDQEANDWYLKKINEFTKESMTIVPLRQLCDLTLHEDLTKVVQDETQNPWKARVIDESVICGIYTKEHDDNPRKALGDIIHWNVQVALDPQVSKEACRLIAQAKQEALESITWRDGVFDNGESYIYHSTLRRMAKEITP